MKTSAELKQLRDEIAKRMKGLNDLAASEKRELTNEEQSAWDKDIVHVRELDEQIRKAEEREEFIRRTAGSPTPAQDPFSPADRKSVAKASLVKMIRSAQSGKPLEGVEAEIAKMYRDEVGSAGLNMGSIGIPSALVRMNEKRDMTVTGGNPAGSEGGFSVSTETGEVVPFLTPKLVMTGLGAQYMGGLVGNFTLPVGNNNVQASWETETSNLDEVNPTMTKVDFSPKRLGCFIDVSERLLAQGPGTEDYVRRLLSNAVAQQLDRTSINGSGNSPEPRGILNTSGIGASAVGGVDGGAVNWAHIVALEGDVDTANALQGNLHYLTTPGLRSKLKSTVKVSNNPVYIVDRTETNGYNIEATTLVPSNLTKGNGTNLHALIFGNFNDLMIAQWGGYEILVDPFTQRVAGNIRIHIISHFDIAVIRPASFSAMKDASIA